MQTQDKEKKVIFYRLDHIHFTDGYRQEIHIGTFSSMKYLEEVIEKLIHLEGFKKHPRDCFITSEVTVDEFGWKKGFKRVGLEDVKIE